jgi:hypothetical protein
MTAVPVYPRDFALLVLASGDLLPRERARDQQADRAGLDLQRRLLERVVECDPKPEVFQAVLLKIANELGPPAGPPRAVAAMVWEQWQAAAASPGLVEHLLREAVGRGKPRRQRAT